jgi:hypothetical protein
MDHENYKWLGADTRGLRIGGRRHQAREEAKMNEGFKPKWVTALKNFADRHLAGEPMTRIGRTWEVRSLMKYQALTGPQGLARDASEEEVVAAGGALDVAAPVPAHPTGPAVAEEEPAPDEVPPEELPTPPPPPRRKRKKPRSVKTEKPETIRTEPQGEPEL